jgi:hypothetical protein
MTLAFRFLVSRLAFGIVAYGILSVLPAFF